jgi:hypothetical protein
MHLPILLNTALWSYSTCFNPYYNNYQGCPQKKLWSRVGYRNHSTVLLCLVKNVFRICIVWNYQKIKIEALTLQCLTMCSPCFKSTVSFLLFTTICSIIHIKVYYPVYLNLPTLGVIMFLSILSAWKYFYELIIWVLEVKNDFSLFF